MTQSQDCGCNLPKEHCCECKEIHKGKNHCLDCHITFAASEYHCCRCKKAWKKSATTHCKQCCSEYHEALEHCCKCKMTWNDSTLSHCCRCKMTYKSATQLHCMTCCAFFGRGMAHCCKCKKSWDPTSQTIPHTCESCECCGKSWDTETQSHCHKCCSNYLTKYGHRCNPKKVRSAESSGGWESFFRQDGSPPKKDSKKDPKRDQQKPKKPKPEEKTVPSGLRDSISILLVVIGLPTEHASLDLIKIRSAYRTKALLLHPDKNPDNIASATEAFKELQNAFEKLVHILEMPV